MFLEEIQETVKSLYFSERNYNIVLTVYVVFQ